MKTMAPSPSDVALHIRKSTSVRSSRNYIYHTKSPSVSPSTTSLSSIGKTKSPTISRTPSRSRASSNYTSTSLAGGSYTQLGSSNLQALKEDNGLVTLRYEEAVPAKPPIAVTVAPPRQPPTDLHPALRRVRTEEQDGEKRDSGLANTTGSGSQLGEGSVRTATGSLKEGEEGYNSGLVIDFDFRNKKSGQLGEGGVEEPSTPTSERGSQRIVTPGGGIPSRAGSMRQWVRSRGSRRSKESVTGTPKSSKSRREEPQIEEGQENEAGSESGHFLPLTTPIPSSGLMEEDFLENITFSNRGSIMFGGKKPINGHLRLNGGRRQQSISMLVTPTVKKLSEDAEKESQKVRSMYEQESLPLWEDGRFSSLAQRIETGEASDDPFVSSTGALNAGFSDRPDSQLSFRNEHELAGGIEDWEDVSGGDVDRYGFISKPRSDRPGSPEFRPPQRVSTMLHMASETPRKKRGFGRSASIAAPPNKNREADRKISAHSLNIEATNSSRRSISRVRSMANRLPGNADRRCMDEAGDMLTLPPGLADIAEDEEGGRAVEGLKKKEWERAEKWRKMAKVNKAGKDGEGMEFEFDARNPKLIERTWKGIPDRWRAAAWYSFLASSAKKKKNSATETEIILAFRGLVKMSSADDQQIDTDVPRTINSHIMFRKRYRGGQRLLFRVLHCLSLYFPDTGYVQGMASLAATLLCYYDEEKTFVMLVRMWTLRGLAQLYAAGFGGLMSALDEFHGKWMKGREVTKKLDELCIDSTSYGTRWYLTLFGYSIPFPAQLRVWDVFMLLGDSDPLPNPSYFAQSTKPSTPRTLASPSIPGTANEDSAASVDFRGGLDILHATSAALIDGTREILLDSDFENAMKVLTSWIPVKDEELLMKVAKAEWKTIRGKRQGR